MAQPKYLSKVRTSFQSNLQYSDNPFVRLVSGESRIAKMMGRRNDSTMSDADMYGDDGDETSSVQSSPSRMKKNAAKGNNDSTKLLSQIVQELRALRGQLQDGQEKDDERAQQEEESRDRASELADDMTSSPTRLSSDGEAIGTSGQAIRDASSGISGIVQKFMSFSKVIEIAMTVFGALIEAVLVLGAAFVGFKIGQWIEKKLEEKFPSIFGPDGTLQKTENWIAKKLGLGGWGDADKTEKWQKEHGQEAAEAGRKIMAERAAKEKAAAQPTHKAAAQPTPKSSDPNVGLVQGNGFTEDVPELLEGRQLNQMPTVTSRSLTPSKQPLGTPSQEVVNAISYAANETGVPVDLLMSMAKQESGFDPTIKARTSSAVGLFQIIDKTWNGLRTKYGKKYPLLQADRTDPFANALGGALLVKENTTALQSKNLPTDAGSLYAGHFLGPTAATKLLSASDDASAADVVGSQAANANKSVFYDKTGRAKKVSEIKSFLTSKATAVTSPPAASRAAAPVATGTTQLASAKTAAPIVIAPTNIAAGGGGGASAAQTPIPVPVRPRDESLSALHTVNAV